ncbi:hypothetical protein, partial [Vibrio anguillarum]|uniref:hypothetical protein n=1 Tax=Vibrio anguillarum TaxID=55601 RepID=UPI001BE4E149
KTQVCVIKVKRSSDDGFFCRLDHRNQVQISCSLVGARLFFFDDIFLPSTVQHLESLGMSC